MRFLALIIVTFLTVAGCTTFNKPSRKGYTDTNEWGLPTNYDPENAVNTKTPYDPFNSNRTFNPKNPNDPYSPSNPNIPSMNNYFGNSDWYRQNLPQEQK